MPASFSLRIDAPAPPRSPEASMPTDIASLLAPSRIDQELRNAVRVRDPAGILSALSRGADPWTQDLPVLKAVVRKKNQKASTIVEPITCENHLREDLFSHSVLFEALLATEPDDPLLSSGAIAVFLESAARARPGVPMGSDSDAAFWAMMRARFAPSRSATAEAGSEDGLLEMAKRLWRDGLSDPNARDSSKSTPLMFALENAMPSWAQALADFSDWSAVNALGRTPWGVAAFAVVARSSRFSSATPEETLTAMDLWRFCGTRVDSNAISLIELAGVVNQLAAANSEAAVAAMDSLPRGLFGRMHPDPLSRALVSSIETGHADNTRILARFADAKRADETGKTPLSAAIAHSKIELIELLWPLSDIDAKGPLGDKNQAGALALALLEANSSGAHYSKRSWGIVDWIAPRWAEQPRPGDTEKAIARRAAIVEALLADSAEHLSQTQAWSERRGLLAEVQAARDSQAPLPADAEISPLATPDAPSRGRRRI